MIARNARIGDLAMTRRVVLAKTAAALRVAACAGDVSLDTLAPSAMLAFAEERRHADVLEGSWRRSGRASRGSSSMRS